MPFSWPLGFSRIPTDKWTGLPLEPLALEYDAVEKHGWYGNLDHTVNELHSYLEDGDLMIDYSGGTGILISRLLERVPDLDFGVINVDASPKFLRLALEKFRSDPRVAYRLIRLIREEARLQRVDEFLDASLVERGVDALVSTNAIHLYQDLEEILRAWARILRPDGRVLIQSGNIRIPADQGKGLIIDDTVEAVDREARLIVMEDDRFASYREVLGDVDRMAAYDRLRERFFLPPRPLRFYMDALKTSGFHTLSVHSIPIEARVDEWLNFLSVYHEGVLGWVGGSERVDGKAATGDGLSDRLELMRRAIGRRFKGRDSFEAAWTYLDCARISH